MEELLPESGGHPCQLGERQKEELRCRSKLEFRFWREGNDNSHPSDPIPLWSNGSFRFPRTPVPDSRESFSSLFSTTPPSPAAVLCSESPPSTPSTTPHRTSKSPPAFLRASCSCRRTTATTTPCFPDCNIAGHRRRRRRRRKTESDRRLWRFWEWGGLIVRVKSLMKRRIC